MSFRKILVACLLLLGSTVAFAAATITGTLNLGAGGYLSFAVDPVLRRVYTFSRATNALTVIDADALQVVGTIPMDANVARVRVDTAHHRVYVLHDGAPGQITAVDGKTLAVIAQTKIADHPSAIAVDFRRGEIYTIHDEPTHTVTFYDTRTNAVTATLQLDAYVYGITVDRNRGKIYVPLFGRREVAVIGQASRAVQKRVSVPGMYPVGVVVEEKNGSVYVSGFPDLEPTSTVDRLAVVDSATDSVRSSTVMNVVLPGVARYDPVPSAAYGRAFFSNPALSQVTVVDSSPGGGQKAIPIPDNPVVSFVNEDDGEVYVVHRTADSDRITIIDARLERVAGTVKPGFRPSLVARLADRLLILGTDAGGNAIVAAATPQGVQPDTVIATDFHHAEFDLYFHTAGFEETHVLQDGIFGTDWLATQQYWRAWKKPGPGRVAVCRFFSTTFGRKSSHVYTPYAQECESLKSGAVWQYEEIGYYVALPDANGACAPIFEELYRLYNEGMGGAPNHAYTNSRARRDALQAKGWTPEGTGPQNVFACTPPLRGFVTSPP